MGVAFNHKGSDWFYSFISNKIKNPKTKEKEIEKHNFLFLLENVTYRGFPERQDALHQRPPFVQDLLIALFIAFWSTAGNAWRRSVLSLSFELMRNIFAKMFFSHTHIIFFVFRRKKNLYLVRFISFFFPLRNFVSPQGDKHRLSAPCAWVKDTEREYS